MQHHFEVEIAEEYGINAAIILDNMRFWTMRNIANERNYYDGRFWTFNTVKSFKTMFPYMSANTISRTFKKLEEDGLIVTGNYNKSAYDRTKWYALTEKAMELLNMGSSISHFGEMDSPESRNGSTDLGEPIPDTKPDTDPSKNTDKRKRFVPPTLEEVAAYCKERGNAVNPQRFMNHYESNGWMVGRNKMKDWRAAVRTWESREFSKQAPKPAYKPNDETEWDFE